MKISLASEDIQLHPIFILTVLLSTLYKLLKQVIFF